MARRGDPEVLRHVVVFLRTYARMTQEELGKASRVAQADVSRYELGRQAPPEESLRRMAAAARVPWFVLVLLRGVFAAIVSFLARRNASGEGAGLEIPMEETALLAVGAYRVEEAAAAPVRQTPEEALREAEEVWAALERFPISRRRALLERAPRASRNWALALGIGESSVRAAADKADEALELADLALFVAERIPEEESRRSRIRAFSRAWVANARRVANDQDGADEAFTQVWGFWPADAESDSLLPEWRLLGLEASLRRDQRRFPEALELLGRARASCGDDTAAVARILLKQEFVFDQMGDIQGALAAVAESAPFVEATGDSGLLFSFGFKTVNNLCHLHRYAEAQEMLPRVQEQAAAQNNRLNSIRVDWLSARIAAGLGRRDEAIAGLEQVQQAFTDMKLPYDAALASLDLAVLWLEAGRTAEVQVLAVGMKWIFEAKKIEPEAMASLRLFCEAAEREAATVELARRVAAEMEEVRHSLHHST